MIHTADSVLQALKISVEELLQLSNTMKLPDQIIVRLIDLIVYSHMESSSINAKLHNTLRIEIKKRLYIRCLKLQPEMAREKMPLLDKERVTVPYIWNSSIEGDELL